MKGATKAVLLDLPTELILNVLAFLYPRDMHAIARTSRRLHSIALPAFLKRYAVDPPATAANIYVLQWKFGDDAKKPYPDILSGLSLTFCSPIRQLRCYFQDPDAKTYPNNTMGPGNKEMNINIFQPLRDISTAIRRLEWFVRNLESLEEIEIFLIQDPYFTFETVPFSNVNRQNWPVSADDVRKWRLSFFDLLNTCLQKGCTQLTVQHDAKIRAPSKFIDKKTSNFMERVLSSFTSDLLVPEGRIYGSPSVAHRATWQFYRPKEDGPLSKPSSQILELLEPIAPFYSTQSLTALFIHSPILLLPPCINATLELLHSCLCLTKLSFALMPFNKTEWQYILPLISTAVNGRLTHFEILSGCPRLEIIDLLQFISSLHLLKALVISRVFQPHFSNSCVLATVEQSPIKLPLFLDMETLHAPVEFVRLVLSRNPDLALPSVRQLQLYPFPFSQSSPVPKFPPSAGVNSLHRLFLEKHTSETERPLVLGYEMDLEISRLQSSVVQFQAIPQGEKGSYQFPNTTHLTIRVPEQEVGRLARPPGLAAYLNAFFPNLRSLRLTSIQAEAPKATARHHEKLAEVGEYAIVWFAKELKADCLQLEELVFGRQAHRI